MRTHQLWDCACGKRFERTATDIGELTLIPKDWCRAEVQTRRDGSAQIHHFAAHDLPCMLVQLREKFADAVAVNVLKFGSF